MNNRTIIEDDWKVSILFLTYIVCVEDIYLSANILAVFWMKITPDLNP